MSWWLAHNLTHTYCSSMQLWRRSFLSMRAACWSTGLGQSMTTSSLRRSTGSTKQTRICMNLQRFVSSLASKKRMCIKIGCSLKTLNARKMLTFWWVCIRVSVSVTPNWHRFLKRWPTYGNNSNRQKGESCWSIATKDWGCFVQESELLVPGHSKTVQQSLPSAAPAAGGHLPCPSSLLIYRSLFHSKYTDQRTPL